MYIANITTELNYQNIIAAFSGILFLCSELLPFFNTIQSNGILHGLILIGSPLLKKIINERNNYQTIET